LDVVINFRFRVQRFGLMVLGSGFRVYGVEFWV